MLVTLLPCVSRRALDQPTQPLTTPTTEILLSLPSLLVVDEQRIRRVSFLNLLRIPLDNLRH